MATNAIAVSQPTYKQSFAVFFLLEWPLASLMLMEKTLPEK